MAGRPRTVAASTKIARRAVEERILTDIYEVIDREKHKHRE